MRIVHAITRLNIGGAALSVLELAAGQQRQGHDVLVVAGVVPPCERSMEYVAQQLEVRVLRLATLQRELSLLGDLSALRALREVIRTYRPHLLHTHTSKAGALGRLAALLSGAARPRALVHTFHGHVLSGYFGRLRERVFRGIERWLARRTSAIIGVSTEVRDDLVRLRIAPAGRVSVVHYGLDLDRRVDVTATTRARLRAELGADANTFVIGWIGRMTSIKRPLDLVRVLRAVRDKGVEAILVMVGDGELRSKVASLATELGVAAHLRLVGYRPDVAGFYGSFDVFALVSANEGTPVAAIEALAAALPVVATTAGGTGAVVEQGESGFLAAPGDITGLSQHLDALARDADLRQRLGATGAARVRAKFSRERMIEDVDALYQRVI